MAINNLLQHFNNSTHTHNKHTHTYTHTHTTHKTYTHTHNKHTHTYTHTHTKHTKYTHTHTHTCSDNGQYSDTRENSAGLRAGSGLVLFASIYSWSLQPTGLLTNSH